MVYPFLTSFLVTLNLFDFIEYMMMLQVTVGVIQYEVASRGRGTGVCGMVGLLMTISSNFRFPL